MPDIDETLTDDEMNLYSPSLLPAERWAGQLTFYKGTLVRVSNVLEPGEDASYEDGVPEHPSIELIPVPAVEPTAEQIDTFKQVWELANRVNAIGSRVSLALGVTLALPHLTPEQEIADLDSGATPAEVAQALGSASPSLDFSREDWVLALAAIRATARRTYAVHGSTPTISRLNQLGDEIHVHLQSDTYDPEKTDQMQHLTEQFYDPKVDPATDQSLDDI